MSQLVCINSISTNDRKKIQKDLNIFSTGFAYGKKDSILCFDVEQKDSKYYMYAPFSYSYHNPSLLNLKSLPNDNINYPESIYTFNKDFGQKYNSNDPLYFLNKIQKEIHEEALEILLRTRSILISLYCGAGKTIYAIYLAWLLGQQRDEQFIDDQENLKSIIGYKTCIFTHRITIMEGWVNTLIHRVCPDAKVQIVTSTNHIDREAHFYIINIVNVCKRNRDDFKEVGILIVDEAHTLCTEKYSQSLFYVQPKYLIGLTATPDRSDGMGSILELYFGPERVVKKLWRPFNVYLTKTSFKPEIKNNKMGGLDWGKVIESQCMDEERNNLIIDIIRYFGNRNFLILCKRKSQSRFLLQRLKEFDEDVDIYISSQKKFNFYCRILISTYSKAGVGFDHPRLDALLVASDVEEGIEQYMGRIFRGENTIPIIFDFREGFKSLYNHLQTRLDCYKCSGGQIKYLERYFPEFYDWRNISGYP